MFRIASLAYVFALFVNNVRHYAHPVVAVPVLLVMAGWTGYTAFAYTRPDRRRWPLLGADLVVTMAVLLCSPWVIGRAALAAGVPTLAVAWLASSSTRSGGPRP